MMDSTSSTMMGSFGVGDALTASSPPLRPIAVTNPPPAPPVHPPMARCFTYLARHKSPIGGVGAGRNASTMAATCSRDDRIGTAAPTPATLAGAATNVAGAFGLGPPSPVVTIDGGRRVAAPGRSGPPRPILDDRRRRAVLLFLRRVVREFLHCLVAWRGGKYNNQLKKGQ